jgi:hypothetical protein
MPQAVDITINDGQGTPVARSFVLNSPASGYEGIAEWQYKSGTTSASFPTLTLSASKTSNKSRKVTGKMVVPYMGTDPLTGQPVVISRYEAIVTVVVPDNFPEANKADAVAFSTNAWTQTLIKACLKDGLPAT